MRIESDEMYESRLYYFIIVIAKNKSTNEFIGRTKREFSNNEGITYKVNNTSGRISYNNLALAVYREMKNNLRLAKRSAHR